ncbi:Tellurite resistance protein TerB [Planctomycetes bacterium K23_9]|uniref:Tellurite resistance protein TerB n=2 Tax=Stieleria marina TaxID=1930275 RepID=A0A517NXH1_9BACT|nr:Tellurite resistance protein TerB [Planctomycetes bacterium K23_9]
MTRLCPSISRWIVARGFSASESTVNILITMSDQKLNQQQRLLRNLVVMAMADGSIGEREVNMVADRCDELGLSATDLQEAIEYGLSDDAALELPSEKAGREELMQELIRMMAADGRLDEGEKRLFALAAVKMDLSSADLDRLIEATLHQS